MFIETHRWKYKFASSKLKEKWLDYLDGPEKGSYQQLQPGF